MIFLKRLKFLSAVARYLWDPNQVDAVLNLGNKLASDTDLEQARSKIQANAPLQEMASQKYGIEDFPMSKLGQLPPDTLGGAYFKFLSDNSLRPHFYKSQPFPSNFPEYDYLVFRARQTHDLWHVVLGFSVSQQDEAGLMAFYFAQMKSQLSGLLVALSFVHFLLRHRAELPSLLDSVSRGWRLGHLVSPLILVKWETLWELPLQEVRSQLKINLR